MTDLPAFVLEHGWEYFPTPDSITYGLSRLDDSAWGRLDSPAAWPSDLLTENSEVYLRYVVNLRPTEGCVNYFLTVKVAPPGTSIYVNGWHVGDIAEDGSFERDVTNFVALDDNVILLKLRQAGALSSIQLRALTCE